MTEFNLSEKCDDCGSKKDLVKHTLNPIKKASFFNRVIYFLTFRKFGKRLELRQGETFFCQSCHYKKHTQHKTYTKNIKGMSV